MTDIVLDHNIKFFDNQSKIEFDSDEIQSEYYKMELK